MELNPYLTFNGNCREAMNFYKDIFGGKFDGGMKTITEGADHFPSKPGHANKIMHAYLRTDDFSILEITHNS